MSGHLYAVNLVAMVRLLCGDNEFAVFTEQKRITFDFLKQHDTFGLQKIDSGEVELSALRDALMQLPFLVAKKLVIIRSPFTSKPVLELLDDLYDQIPEEIDVLLVDSKSDKRMRLYKRLQKKGSIQEFFSLKGSALVKWVVEYAHELHTEIKNSDAEYLVERVGTSQMILARELEKLAIDKPITRDIIEHRTDQQLQSTIFELLDYVFAGDSERSFRIYDELLAQKTDPSEILPLIAWQLNIFAVVMYSSSKNPSDIASSARIHPFVVGKALKITRKISKQSLKEAIAMTLDADLKMKTSSGDSEDVLRVLLLKLTS